MAIQKAKTLPNGAQGNYWKIISISMDKVSMKVSCQIALFSDRAHSIEKAPHLGFIKSYVFPITGAESKEDLISLAYSKIKARAAAMVHQVGAPNAPLVVFDPDLSDAQDV